MQNQENKQTSFCLRYTIPSHQTLEISLLKFESFFRQLHLEDVFVAFYNSETNNVCICFRIIDRKRSTQLSNLIKKILPLLEFQIVGVTKDKLFDTIKLYMETDGWQKINDLDRITYQGRDLKLFEDPSNFYSWQKTLLSYIFDNDNNFRIFDSRELLFFLDFEGNKGKSTFVKYLCWRYQDDIVRVSFGQTGQLRSALIDAGRRRVYIIDIPRTVGKTDSISDMLVTAEEVSCGMLTSPFYGKFTSSFFEPPLVIIFANNHLPYQKLSLDRWHCFEINSRYKAKEIDVKSLIKAQKRKKL